MTKPPSNKASIVIYRLDPVTGRKMYLTSNGQLSAYDGDAAHHWGMQFTAVVAENPIVKPAHWELAYVPPTNAQLEEDFSRAEIRNNTQ